VIALLALLITFTNCSQFENLSSIDPTGREAEARTLASHPDMQSLDAFAKTGSETEALSSPSDVEIDLDLYLRSHFMPAGMGLAAQRYEDLSRRGWATNTSATRIVGLGKFGDAAKYWEIMVVYDDRIEIVYEGYEGDFIRRLQGAGGRGTPSMNPTTPISTVEGLGLPIAPRRLRLSQMGQLFRTSATVDNFKHTVGRNPVYDPGTSGRDNVSYVWFNVSPRRALPLEANDLIPNHKVTKSNQWEPCTLEEYDYVAGVGMVEWRYLIAVDEICRLKPGDSVGHVVASNLDARDIIRKTGPGTYDNGSGRPLKTKLVPSAFKANRAPVLFVEARPDFLREPINWDDLRPVAGLQNGQVFNSRSSINEIPYHLTVDQGFRLRIPQTQSNQELPTPAQPTPLPSATPAPTPFPTPVPLSAEDQALRQIIRQLYSGLLGVTTVDPAGYAFWINSYRTSSQLSHCEGVTVTFLQNHGSLGLGSSVDSVTRMYRGVLGREPDQDGLTFWRGHIDTGALSRIEVARQIVQSEEFKRRCRAAGFQ
jgi:hypothetical protein